MQLYGSCQAAVRLLSNYASKLQLCTVDTSFCKLCEVDVVNHHILCGRESLCLWPSDGEVLAVSGLVGHWCKGLALRHGDCG